MFELHLIKRKKTNKNQYSKHMLMFETEKEEMGGGMENSRGISAEDN